MSTYILVAGHAGIGSLVTTAQQIGERTVAVVLGERAVADVVATSGVDQVQWLGEPEDKPLEAFAPAVAELVAAAAPRTVLAANRAAERSLAGAVAAEVAASVLSGVSCVEPDGDHLVVTCDRFGGVVQESLRVSGPVVLVLEGSEPLTGDAAEIEEVSVVPVEGLVVTQTHEAEPTTGDLTKASRVVAVGRGISAREDLGMIEDLAAAVGAEIACSRPLSEGLDWFGHDSYVGVTGQHVSPELYVAVGISGQFHHSAGARESGTIVVVNADADAPYVKEADYSVIGDLYEVVPAIIAALR